MKTLAFAAVASLLLTTGLWGRDLQGRLRLHGLGASFCGLAW